MHIPSSMKFTSIVFSFSQAVDNDAGRFGAVRYFLISTNSKSLFSLNPKTGAVSVTSSLMPYADKTFNLVIGARDNVGGLVSNIAKQNATVTFRIEPASVDVVCETLLSAAMVKTRSDLFKR